MKRAVRILAGINAIFQIVIGLLSVASPLSAAEAFKVEASSPAMLALIRMFGGLLASSGILSAVIARNPDENRSFVRTYAAVLLLNVGADAVVIGTHEMQFGQLASGMILELVLAMVLLMYVPKAESDH